MNNINQIKFNLDKISTEQFAILSEPPNQDTQVVMTTDGRFGFDPENKLIGVFAKVTFIGYNDQPFLQIEGGCHFRIAEQDWNKCLNKSSNTLVFPKDFAVHLLMLSVGTTRGILHAKIENTRYNMFYIPLIDVTKLVEKDIVFELTE